MRDYYKDMDLATNATKEEIRGQYKRLARQYHPDKNPNNPYAEQRFKEVTEAYKTLGDQSSRSVYDGDRSNFYEQKKSSNQRQPNREQGNPFKDSKFWGAVGNMASGVAQDFIHNLNKEMLHEEDGVDPFVERVAKVNATINANGSISIKTNISKNDLRVITEMASRGMDIEEFSADVGVLVASVLVEAIQKNWRSY